MPLHDYQEYGVGEVEQLVRDGAKSVLLTMPTGSGKTHCAVALIERLPKPTLFLTHRREIFDQTVRKLVEHGIDPAVLMPGVTTGNAHQLQIGGHDMVGEHEVVTVAMQMTAHSRMVRLRHKLPDYKTIIIDEAHHALAKTWLDVLRARKSAVRIGLTATPCRGDGRGLGDLFQHIVQPVDYTQLLDGGYLVDAPLSHIYTWPFDDSGVRVRMGDYAMGGEQGAAKRLDQTQIIGDAVGHWVKLASDRKTVVFASSVEHAVHLSDKFSAAGVCSDYISSKTDPDERREIIDNFRDGNLQVLCNFGILTEGTDIPTISCISLLRPTKQFGLYLQMVGRGLRTAPGKDELMLLDHVGIVPVHGLPTQDIQWELETSKIAAALTGNTYKRVVSGCPKCGKAMHKPPCSACGWKPDPIEHGAGVAATGELVRMSDGAAVQVEKVRADPLRSEYWRLRKKAEKDGRRNPHAFAAFLFNKQHKYWPPALWYLPDPRQMRAEDYYAAARRFADKQSYQKSEGYAAHAFREAYGRWPPQSVKIHYANLCRKQAVV